MKDSRKQGSSNRLEKAARLYRAGRWRECLKACQGITSSAPGEAAAWNLGGAAALKLGDPERAVEMSRRAVELEPEFARALGNLGNALKAAGRPDEGLDSLRKAAAIDPQNVAIQNSLALALRDSGELDEAVSVCRRAIKAGSGVFELHLNLGNILGDLGRHEEAAGCFSEAISLNPQSPEINNNLGVSLRKLGRLAEAEASFRRALETKPDFAEAHANLGMLLFKLDHREKGMNELREALALAPDNPHYRYAFSSAVEKMVPPWHFKMINDTHRNACYKAAIERAVGPGKRVLEIGTGSGLLSMIAARAGADRVITCEMVPLIAEKARQIIAANGLAGKITSVVGKSTDLDAEKDLGGRADVIISEILSDEFLGEAVLPFLSHARTSLLKEGGVMIPRHGTMMAFLAGPGGLENLIKVETILGFDMSLFNEFSPAICNLPPGRFSFERLSGDFELFHFDFMGEIPPHEALTQNIEVSGNGKAIGLVQWNRLGLDGETVLENHPDSTSGESHWNQVLHCFPTPLDVKAGDKVGLAKRRTETEVYFGLGRG